MRNLFNEKVNVLRIVAKQSDGIGGVTGVESVLHYQLSCYIAPSSGTEREAFKRESKFRTHTMQCRVVDIKESDVVVSESLRYEVLDVYTVRGRFLAISLSLVR
jgi:hypothetical protein